MHNPGIACSTAVTGFVPHLAERGRRRRQRRAMHRVPCRVRVFESDSAQVRVFCGETVNLSPGGVAVQLGQAVREGTWVEALLPRLTGAPLTVCGTVVHCRRVLTGTFEVGIEIAPDSETRP